MFFDPMYFVFTLPALALALYAQWRVRSTYSKYSKIANAHQLTGADVARRLLDAAGLYDVQIERVPGDLTDHYDPGARVVRLSDSNYASYSVAALGVTAHEVGHAIQHATAYGAMRLRTALVPVAGIGSTLGYVLFIIGFFISMWQLATVGLILFSAAALFAAVTLPVEFNASSRAMTLLSDHGLVNQEDYGMAKRVLNAAALTYVAGLAQALSQVLYYGMLLSGMRRSDD
ncbi:MAG: probable metal-dependent peptidase [uncultured Chloroflexi bacterium]|uniref:Probable metal-dependent peptidase n=1 Tax=uncultured Chloroflexota bacterium TaxID=166587 RepID=A0A6J4I936_9CHLR|nr:MAG: probable metal-dependent peptidase [uncultured Chloroflexota bacterium]